MNKIVLMGRLTAEPELKTTTTGLSVCSFTLACDRDYVKAGTERQADFIDCVAWRTTAEHITKWFHKGQLTLVTGSLQTRTYQDKNGNNRKAVEVVVDNVYFTGDKKDGGSSQSYSNNNSYSNSYSQPVPEPTSYSSGSINDFEELPSDDDLPF